MQKTYGRTLFDKKRKEQAEHFHSLILDQKIKPEYDSLDRLVEDKSKIVNEVQKALVVKRNQTRHRIDRLKIMINKIQQQIQETRIH